MANPTFLSFGACQINLLSRDLVVAGVRQTLPPRAFQLLLDLIQNRERVVSKDELLDRVWGGAVVSESVIARTVMKVRQAIGDVRQPPSLIKTVHRVGYRFAGEVRESSAPATLQPTETERVRLAVMPFRNATGRDDLGWAAFGLATLVAKALASNTQLAVVEPNAVASAVAGLPDGMASTQRTLTLTSLLGATCLLSAVLRASGAHLRLDFRVEGAKEMRGSLQGEDPLVLGQRLAQSIADGLNPVGHWPVAFGSDNPMTQRLLARSFEVEQRKDWPTASALLEQLLALEPDNLPAQLQYLRVLANLHDERALELGQALLDRAMATSDQRLQASIHEALGRACFNLGSARATQTSSHHLREAMRLAAPYLDEDWVVRIHLGLAIQSQTARDLERAKRLYRLARRGADRSGNLMLRATILNNQAATEAQSGNPIWARELAEEALAVSQRHYMIANAVNAASNLAMTNASLGLLGRARKDCEQAISMLPSLPPYELDARAWVAVIAGDLQQEGGEAGLHESALQFLPSAASSTPIRVTAVTTLARAFAAPAVDLDPEPLIQAVQAVGEAGYPVYGHTLASPLLMLLLRRKRHDAVQRLTVRLTDWPTLSDDLDLRAGLLFAAAAARHEAGDTPSAERLLREAISLSASGRWQAHARLAMAWLALEAGRIEPAVQLLGPIGPWLEEHPAGVATWVRLHLAQGHLSDATAEQVGLLDTPHSDRSEFLAAVARACETESAAIPKAPRLISLL